MTQDDCTEIYQQDFLLAQDSKVLQLTLLSETSGYVNL